jgi:membrane protease YdiL (CAAX protease family)
MMVHKFLRGRLNYPQWSFFDAVLALGIVFLAKYLLPLERMEWFWALSEALSPARPVLGGLFLSALFRNGLFVVLIVLLIKKKYRLDWQEIGLRTDQEKRWLPIGISQGVVLFLLVIAIGLVISVYFPVQVEPQQISLLLATAGSRRERLLAFMVTSLIAPFSEELYFRGILYPSLAKMTGRVPALLLSSAFFGLLHLDLVRFIPIAFGGVWLALLYERTGSLYTSITAHAVWNSLMMVLLYLSPHFGAGGVWGW